VAVTAEAAAGQLRRDPAGGIIAGVCSGVARRLGIDPILLRVAVVASCAAGGAGFFAYALAWALIPDAGGRPAIAMRIAGRRDAWLVVGGSALLLVAALLLLRRWGIWFSDAFVWPVLLAGAGGALIWRQSVAAPPRPEPVAPPAARASDPVRLPRLPVPSLGPVASGALLVVAAALTFLWLNHALAPAKDVLLAVIVVMISATVILAPWWLRLVRGLSAERAERIRSQERAEVAAHLHDSVLQTLALVQRRAEDPAAVAQLARRQERELRAWLNGGGPAPGESLAASLEAAAAEVEETHRVPVDVVAVGDAPLDDDARALVAAAREAMVNAAKFAGPVQLFAEVSEDRTEVFVRDRGPGFDVSAVPADRRGVSESIVGRMQRHGGRAIVHSVPGEGTEVELVIER
jgi:phage shock protein PspC (stress-responsive transcriptional regulator)/anti-sigma regulatory factor (Ser/Thr protein kinase)